MAEKDAKKISGKNCCVVDCSAKYLRENCGFFRVIRADKIQSDKWIKAINRINPDGSPWKPSEHTVICGAHFLHGKPSKMTDDPDYVPSKFPTKHRREATEQDAQRMDRVILYSKETQFRHSCTLGVPCSVSNITLSAYLSLKFESRLDIILTHDSF